MLNEEQFINLCNMHQLNEHAIARVRNIRNSNPSRNVASGTHNVATHFASRKMGRVIKAEARCTELAILFHWEHDPTVYEFYDQPPQIKKITLTPDGRERAHRYTPDFFLIAESFIGWVEAKEENWLKRQLEGESRGYIRDQDGEWQCPAAVLYADRAGLGFHVQTSADTDPVAVQNLSDLSDYYRSDCAPVNSATVEVAVKLLGDEGWAWLRDLLFNEVGVSADAIYKMIVDEQLFVDLKVAPLMSEPHRVRVFKSQALLDSSSLWLPSMLAPAQLGLPKLDIRPGAHVIWDGRALEILNDGEKEIVLNAADGSIVPVRRITFLQLVGEGKITGTASPDQSKKAVMTDLLKSASPADIDCAKHRYYCLHPERTPDGAPYRASDRSLHSWRKLARRGEIEYGSEFLALIPGTKRRGNRCPRLEEPVRKLMQQTIEDEVLSPKKSGQFVAWSQLRNKCNKIGLEPPSLRTFKSAIKRARCPEELTKARQGEKAGYPLEMPYLTLERTTPKHGCRAFDVGHIDHTEMDLQFVDESNGRSMKKAWLTVLLDAYTRVVLAWVILFDPPSYRSCMLVIRDCVRRHQRIPMTIVCDQGSEFNGIYFEQLLALLGTNKRMRPASKPRFGSVIERFFGLTNTGFLHALQGNNQALQSPRSMSPTHNPVDLAVWNLRKFREAFEGFLQNVYHVVEHSTLGVSPTNAFEISKLQAGVRHHTLVPYNRDFVIATMPSTKNETAKIQKNRSFKANHWDYSSPRFAPYVGQNLPVKYDPYDVSVAYVHTNEGWIEGYNQYASILAGRSQKEVEAISLELNELHGHRHQREKNYGDILGAYMDETRELEAYLEADVQIARSKAQRATYGENDDLLTTPPETECAEEVGTEEGSNVVPIKPPGGGRNSQRQMQRDVFEHGQRTQFGDFE